jgi:chemotaxis receptor (MCP) glutamine deamidase CheD
VTATTGVGTPTGDVILYKNSVAVETVTLAAGVAVFTAISNLDVGNYNFEAVYQGDGTYDSSVSSVVKQTVDLASTATVLVSSNNPSIYGEAVVFTATVTATTGVGTPTGDVILYKNGAVVETVTLAAGVATFTAISDLDVGNYNFVAVYVGDGNFDWSSSATVMQTVDLASTATALVSDNNPSIYGEAVVFTATVTATTGAGTPTGDVILYKNGAVVETVTLVAGVAVFTTISDLPVGNYNFEAAYVGDGNFDWSSSATVMQTVNLADTATVLVSSNNPSIYGEAVVFTATVTATTGVGTPTGDSILY